MDQGELVDLLELLERTGEMEHLAALLQAEAGRERVAAEEAAGFVDTLIFPLIRDLADHLGETLRPGMTADEQKEVVACWIEERIRLSAE